MFGIQLLNTRIIKIVSKVNRFLQKNASQNPYPKLVKYEFNQMQEHVVRLTTMLGDVWYSIVEYGNY